MRNLLMLGAVLSLACASVADAQGRGGGGTGGLGGGIGGGRTAAPPITSRTTPTLPSQTAVRGAADVLPGTNASARGVERGSTSTARATAHFADNTIVRDSRGATVGRVVRTVTLADGDLVTLPSAGLTMDGRYANSTLTKAQIRALARAPAG